MENLLKSNKTYPLVVLALIVATFTLARCTAPVPEPVTLTVTEIERVEIPVEVVRYIEPDRERDCLAKAIYAEARNESAYGQEAVANSILNRRDDYRFPNTICQVVRQKHRTANGKTVFQFSYQSRQDNNFYRTARVFADMRVTDEETRARETAYEVADRVMAGHRVLATNSFNYHADYVQPDWADNLTVYKTVGAHIFYTGF